MLDRLWLTRLGWNDVMLVERAQLTSGSTFHSAETFGRPLELISAKEAAERFPPLDIAGVLGAPFLPTDGYLDPSQLTLALAKGARLGGADIRTTSGRRHRRPAVSCSRT